MLFDIAIIALLRLSLAHVRQVTNAPSRGYLMRPQLMNALILLKLYHNHASFQKVEQLISP